MGFFWSEGVVYKPVDELDLTPDSDEVYIIPNVKGLLFFYVPSGHFGNAPVRFFGILTLIKQVSEKWFAIKYTCQNKDLVDDTKKFLYNASVGLCLS